MTRSDIDWNRLPMDWVGDWAGRRAALTPERTALVDGTAGRRWCYAELDAWVQGVAHWLTESLALRAGDRLALLMRNTPEAVAIYLACGKTGIVLVPLSHRLTGHELDTLVARSGAGVVLTEPVLRDHVPREAAGACRVVVVDEAVAVRVDAAPAADCNRALALNDPFLYVHTGGSTGVPKLCVISHRQMVWNSVELIATNPEGLGRRRELVLFPLYHIGGWNTLTPILHAGGCVILLPDFDPAAVLATVAAERVNHVGAVEAMLRAISAHPAFATTDLSSLTAITTAGAPCSDAAMAPFRDRGIMVAQSYGQTEAGPSNFVHLARGDDPQALVRHSQSIGTSFMHCDFRIVDTAGRPVAEGTTGELWMRSPHAFDGYVDDPARTEQTLDAAGWVHSGDLARRDETGRVHIVGRVDNMFVCGGENLAPEEIESVLLAHPRIAQAMVFPQADTRWGAVPEAAVSRAAGESLPTADELDTWLEGRLARFKRPRRYHELESLPVTAAGKLDRAALRQRFAATNTDDAEG